MEEEQIAVSGEATPAPSASEPEAVSEVESSEVGTSDQPTQETTEVPEAPKSRAQERIRELSKEANYWKDLALSNAPLKEEKAAPAEESDGVGIEEIAKAVVAELETKERLTKAEQAQKTMYEDALRATAEFPELDTDERLAKRVIAIAQADGISITDAAREYLGQQKQATRKSAEAALKSGVSAPQATKVSSGEPAVIDIWSMPEEQRKANWSTYIAQLAEQQSE